MITGAITEKENNKNNIWGSWVYQGELVTIEIKTPSQTFNDLKLHIGNIAYGYKDIYKSVKASGFGLSGACNINVICPLGNGWETERNSVSLILSDDGSRWCSGALIMNTCKTNRPFYLTADHCFNPPGLPQQNVGAWRFTFQAFSPVCTPSQNSDGVITYNGSTLRANWASSDVCLVELNNTPAISLGINYSGWNRSNTAATSGTGIHHPQGDVMKISRANSVMVGSYNSTVNQHWRADWNQGVTEPGSSGSPLFDQNHRIIGQLHGGPSVCGGTQLWDFYGRFDLSWTGGGSNATRLSNWLDPSGSNAITTNTSNINTLISASSISGGFSIIGDNAVCTTSPPYTVPNLPTGSSVQWSVLPAGLVTVNTPIATQTTLTKISDGLFTLTATITSNCGTFAPVKLIMAGVPTSSGYALTGSNFICPVTGLTLIAKANNIAIDQNLLFQYSWFPSSVTIWGAGTNTGGTNNSTRLYFPNPGNATGFNMVVRAGNQCGLMSGIIGPKNYIRQSNPPFCYSSSGSLAAFTVSPNPAGNNITIASTEMADYVAKGGAFIKAIKIVDALGTIKFTRRYFALQKQQQVTVNNLPVGKYQVAILTDAGWQNVPLLIVR